jgi:putative ATP-binding cassette transporter
VTSVVLTVVMQASVITHSSVMDYLKLRWRIWLTEQLQARWTAGNSFYDIEREGRLQNADQRIAEDVRLFTEESVSMFTNIVNVMVQLGTFVVLLWQLSQAIGFDIGTRHFVVRGYLVYVAFAYSLGGFVVTHLFGRRMMPLNMQKQGVEADYRYLAMQLRENAEQIAFYGGGPREHGRLVERFAYVRENSVRIIVRLWKVQFSQTVYSGFLSPLPTLAALPLYFTGKVTYGAMTQVVSVFGIVTDALSFFSQAYTSFTAWIAVANRVRDLSAALDMAEARPSGISIAGDEGSSLRTDTMSLQAPDGRELTIVAPVQVEPGGRLLIRGASGTGKSTFLRALAGLWPYGTGRVVLPAKKSMLFLPQRSYIPSGSLRAALCYPKEPKHFTDAQCVQALAKVDLVRLIPNLEQVERWQQKLSGGEQQRLAFARVLLHRPDFVFLDEATSGLDPTSEERLYELLTRELRSTAIVSIAHRESIAGFHTNVLELHPATAGL